MANTTRKKHQNGKNKTRNRAKMKLSEVKIFMIASERAERASVWVHKHAEHARTLTQTNFLYILFTYIEQRSDIKINYQDRRVFVGRYSISIDHVKFPSSPAPSPQNQYAITGYKPENVCTAAEASCFIYYLLSFHINTCAGWNLVLSKAIIVRISRTEFFYNRQASLKNEDFIP